MADYDKYYKTEDLFGKPYAELIVEGNPTMIFVEHDKAFCDLVATKSVYL